MTEENCGVAQLVEQVTVNDQVVGSSPASTALPEIMIMQEEHKLFAVMGYDKKYSAIRIPRQYLHMSDEDQKWFLNSQGIAEKLLKKLGLI